MCGSSRAAASWDQQEAFMANELAALSTELAAIVQRTGPSVVAVHARPRFASSGVFWRPRRHRHRRTHHPARGGNHRHLARRVWRVGRARRQRRRHGSGRAQSGIARARDSARPGHSASPAIWRLRSAVPRTPASMRPWGSSAPSAASGAPGAAGVSTATSGSTSPSTPDLPAARWSTPTAKRSASPPPPSRGSPAWRFPRLPSTASSMRFWLAAG